MPRLFQQNEATSSYRRFPIYLVDNVSGLYPTTGETGTPQVTKNGSSWLDASGSLTEVGHGHYYIDLIQDELDTPGYMSVRYKTSNTAEFNMDGQVVSFDPYSSTNMGMSALPTVSPAANGGLPTVDATNYIAGIQGSVNTLDGISGVMIAVESNVVGSGNAWLTAEGFSTLTQGDILSDATPFAGSNIDQTVSNVRISLSGLMESVESNIISSGTAWTTNTLTQAQVTGGAYALDTDANGRIRIVDGTSTGELDTTSGKVDVNDKTGFSLTDTNKNEVASGVWEVDARILTANTNFNDPTADTIANSVWNEALSDHTTPGSVGNELGSLSGVLDGVRNDILASGTEWKTAVGFSTLTQTDILSDATPFSGANINEAISAGRISLSGIIENTESNIIASGTAWTTAVGFSTLTSADIDTALKDINLDHLVKIGVDTDWNTTVHVDSIIGYIADSGSNVFNRITDSQQAIRDNQAGSDVGSIADAVWNESLSDHVSAGTVAERLDRLPDFAFGTPSGILFSLDGVGISGALIDAKVSTAGSTATVDNDAIADAVWNESISDHTGAGSTGAQLISISGQIDNVESHGDSTWSTAVGFSTHSATDVWEDGVKASGAYLDTKLSTLTTSVDNDAIADSVWNEVLSDHTEAGSAGNELGSISGILDTVRNDILSSGVEWKTAVGFSTHSATDIWQDGIKPSGAYLDTKLSTLTTNVDNDAIADAVWNEAIGDHIGIGSTGAQLISISGQIDNIESHGDSTWSTAVGFSTHSATDIWQDGVKASGAYLDTKLSTLNISVDNDAVADAVWNEALSDHTETGSVGNELGSLSGILDTVRNDVLTSGVEWKTAVGFSTHSETDVWSDGVKPSGAKLDVSVSSRSTLSQSDILDDATPFSGSYIDQTVSNVRISLSGIIEGIESNIVSSGNAWLTAEGFSTHSATDVWQDGVKASGAYIDQKLSTSSVDNDAIADAVWDETRSGHTTQGTYGESFTTLISGAATSTTLSTTQMSTDLTESTNDHYNGRIIIWTTGDLTGQATDITDYNGSTKTLTFTAVTEAPSTGNKFIIV